MQVLVFSSLLYSFQTWPEGDTLSGCVGCSDLSGCSLGRAGKPCSLVGALDTG